MAAPIETPQALEAARVFVERGWRPFPCEYRGKRPAVGIKWGTATNGKSDPTDKVLQLWFGRDPVNVGIAAKGSGLTFLDDDTGTADAMEKLCEAYGQPVPVTYRVRTSKGWHWYFNTPEGAEIANAGQGSYLKDEFGFDVRGNRGGQEKAGGYVVGPGSVHESGHVYQAEDPDVEVADLPEWLHEILKVNAAAEREQPEATTKPAVDPDRERPYTMEQAAKYVREEGMDKLYAATEGGRNDALNTAAVVAGHFVPDFWEYDEVTGWLTDIADGKGLTAQEIGPTIASGLRKGMSEPYTRVDDANPFEQADGSSAGGVSAFDKELDRQRIQRQVRQLLDAEDREALQVLDFDQFMDSPLPDYLVPKMFYRDGLSVVFGPPGAAKSFLVLDIALCLASGTKWREHDLGRGRVHYVMAEGQATNVLRTLAWMEHHKVGRDSLREWFTAIPVPIMLTDAGIVDYLMLAEKDQPDLVILDTKNLMFTGKESQGEDYGLMLRVLHRIRQAIGGGAVVMIDHTGLNDETRTRGSNAQKGGLETEIAVADANGVRVAKVTRDKSGEVGEQWSYKLQQVPSVSRPAGVSAPAVCVAIDPSDIVYSPFSDKFEDWNDPTQPDLPRDIVSYDGPGKAAIKAVARFMRFSTCGQEVGFSQAQAKAAVKAVYMDDKGKPKWSNDTIDRGWNALVKLERLVPAEATGGATSRSLWEMKSEDPE